MIRLLVALMTLVLSLTSCTPSYDYKADYESRINKNLDSSVKENSLIADRSAYNLDLSKLYLIDDNPHLDKIFITNTHYNLEQFSCTLNADLSGVVQNFEIEFMFYKNNILVDSKLYTVDYPIDFTYSHNIYFNIKDFDAFKINKIDWELSNTKIKYYNIDQLDKLEFDLIHETGNVFRIKNSLFSKPVNIIFINDKMQVFHYCNKIKNCDIILEDSFSRIGIISEDYGTE